MDDEYVHHVQLCGRNVCNSHLPVQAGDLRQV